MTLLELLNKVFGNKLNEEIVDTSITTEVEKDETSKENPPTDKKNPDNEPEIGGQGKKDETSENVEVVENKGTEENGGVDMVLFETGWFNSETGEVDESKIKNTEVLAAIKTLTGRYTQEKNQRLISDSLNDELKNYSLNVSNETLRKMLDMSEIKVDKDGKAVGVKEAIEKLKTAEPGVFKDKDKESNPLNEGFNPVEKKTTMSEDKLIELIFSSDE